MSTRSRASSKSRACTSFSPRRTANNAASLTRLARSAPLIPGFPRDDVDVDVVGDLLVAEVHLQDRDPLLLGGEGTMI